MCEEILTQAIVLDDGKLAVDGVLDPARWRSILASVRPRVPVSAAALRGAQVLPGEQTNTSVLLPNLRLPQAPHGSILKVLQSVVPDEHPDVAVPRALAATGYRRVPRVVGTVVGNVAGIGRADLAILSELIPETDDGFELAVSYARTGRDFSGLARELGSAVAGLHAAMRLALPVSETLDAEWFVDQLRDRARAAIAQSAPLAPLRELIEAQYDGVAATLAKASAPGPIRLQRIHGDLHLGQTLHSTSPERAAAGWYFIDFEGEPMRSAAHRTAADLPLRDIAGMLRSFDYAAAVGQGPVSAGASWPDDAAAGFLDGYRAAAGPEAIPAWWDDVLAALCLDKALYEVAYETVHRPDWVGIPLAAVHRLLAGPSALPLAAVHGVVSETKVGAMTNSPTPDAAPAPKSNADSAKPETPKVSTAPGAPVAAAKASAKPAVATPVATAVTSAKDQKAAPAHAAAPTTVTPQTPVAPATTAAPATAAPSAAAAAPVTAAPVKSSAPVAPAKATAAAAAPPAAKAPVATKPAAAKASTPAPPTTDPQAFWDVANGNTYDPHSILGAHLFKAKDGSDWAVVRALRPLADEVDIVTTQGTFPAPHAAGGVFEAVVPVDHDKDGKALAPDYRVRTRYGDDVETQDDPYRFMPTVQELDLHLIGEGRHEELWKVLGANQRTYHSALGDVTGTSFAVWAPNARAVRVIGDWNRWTPINPMRSLGSTGVWEVFIPGVGEGAVYKFEIQGPDGNWFPKADPLAKWAEIPPDTASRVFFSDYKWGDDAWMKARAKTNPLDKPISIYELHVGSWKLGKSYRELAEELPAYINDLGFTHVEFMPIAEHPFGGSWGYQVTGYYAPTSRFGDPDDFRYLVDKLHQAGIGVIMDWVPAHFPKDAFALGRFDGTPLYEHGDPRLGEHPDWGTYVFDFGRTEVRNFLVANATYWYEDFHIDGLRVDAVASMLYRDYSRKDGEWFPNVYGGRENLEAIAFLQEANATAYKRTPGVMMIAEESTAFPGVTAPTSNGGLGFGLKWNMGWMNDSLRYMQDDPMYRRYHHGELTFSLVYAFSEQYVLPISHDEVVHGKGSLINKMPGDRWQQFANVRAFLAYMWTHPGKQLLFMGSEFGQDQEWSEEWGLNWWLLDSPWHAALQKMVKDLNAVYKANPALWERDFTPDGFEWLDVNDADRNTIAYVRKDAAGHPVCAIINFAGQTHENYRLALPAGGKWKVALNTDDTEYGGSGAGPKNGTEIVAEDVPYYGREHSVNITVPPLGALILTPEH